MQLSHYHSFAWLSMIVLLIVGTLFSLISGPMQLPVIDSFKTVWDNVFHTELSTLSPVEQLVITDLRWPRTLTALIVGGLLSLCGAVTQGLFRNPLADPSIIGVSSGAGLGAAIAIVIMPISMSTFLTPIAAFIGGLLTTLLVYRLARSQFGETSVIILLLAGVAISAFSGAIVGFLSFIADDQALRTLSLWGMGSLTNSSHDLLGLGLICLIALAVFYRSKATALNALLLGEAEARHLGINVEQLKVQLIITLAIGVGVAVSMAGIIGFISLVIPHLIRLTLGPDHRQLLLLSTLCGAGLLLLADIGARTWLAPAELPVGLVTAFIGAPFFMVLLLQQRQRLSQF
jgi:iron complex transport system permease protein